MSELLVSVSRTVTQRDAYKAELNRSQAKCSELNVAKLKLEMQNDSLNHYVKVLQVKTLFYDHTIQITSYHHHHHTAQSYVNIVAS